MIKKKIFKPALLSDMHLFWYMKKKYIKECIMKVELSTIYSLHGAMHFRIYNLR